MEKAEKIFLVILLIISSNLITAWIISEVVITTVVTDLAFSPNAIVIDDGRFITIHTRTGPASYYRRGIFGTPSRFVENIDIVPTAESAARIADIISSAMSCERYGEFNPLEHDVGVIFTENDNKWEVFYYSTEISRQNALFIARGGFTRGNGRRTIGPSFIINKTTGEIIILHEGSS